MRKKLPGFALLAQVLTTGDADDTEARVQLFYGVPNPMTAGARVVLFWDVPNAPKVRIRTSDTDTGAMVNDPDGGYLVVDPGPIITTTYTLTALDDSGAVLSVNGAEVSTTLTLTVH